MSQEQSQQPPIADFDLEPYMDRSFDHVARVQEAREAAQREMESFGDVSEYDITVLQGQKKDEDDGAPQASLNFQDDAASTSRETK